MTILENKESLKSIIYSMRIRRLRAKTKIKTSKRKENKRFEQKSMELLVEEQ